MSSNLFATVMGVLIEVPVMLMLFAICMRSCHLFRDCNLGLPHCKKSKWLIKEEPTAG